MSDDSLRELAVASLKKKAGFKRTAVTFVIIWVLLIVIWAVTGQGYFWPIWVIFGLGIATIFSAWSAYGPRDKAPSQSKIEEEARKFEDG